MSKQQRRKGNAKNASSSAAHELLAQGGAQFVGLTSEMNIFEVASSNRLHHVSEIDDEARIIIKKLTKKDCLTREKGLKELMQLVDSETTSIENCFEHFCGLVSQLSTDGSPSVRMLTMKAISMFLVKLKKSASKGLKKIIPMVLFSKSDVTNGVAIAASSVIRDGFDVDKRQQVIELFAPLTFEMAAKIAQGKHEISIPIEYDGSEDKDARSSRLETQSLNVFFSYIKEFGSKSDIWEEHARQLFRNVEYIKKTFSGNKEALKVQLLNICYRMKDHVDVIMSLPPIVPYIQNTLDAQTFTSECAVAWDGLIMLIPSEKFQAKVSLQKGLLPRILNVIRKKGNHWRVLKHYLLTAVVVLLKELKDGNMKTLVSIIESFADNLPWKTEYSMNAIHCWFVTFSDFVKWILTNDQVNLDILKSLMPQIITMMEQAIIINTSESTETMSSLIFWIIEAKVLSSEETASFRQQIERTLVTADAEKSRLMRDAITSSGRLIELSELHANLLSTCDFAVIRNLARSEDSYFNSTLEKIQNFKFIETTDAFDFSQSEDVVKLIQRIVKSHSKELSIPMKNDPIGRSLLLLEDSDVWEAVLRTTPEVVFQEMVNFWHEKRNGKAIAKAVSFLKTMDIVLNTDQAAENVEFLISLLQSNETDNSEERHSLVLKIFSALFESEEEPKQDHFEFVRNQLGSNFNPGSFFQTLLDNDDEFETERIIEISARFDKLIGMMSDELKMETAHQILLSFSHLEEMARKLSFLELEVVTHSPNANILAEPFSHRITHLDEQESTKMVKLLGRLALFTLASKYHTEKHQLFGWQVSKVVACIAERYCLKHLNEELHHLKQEIEHRLVKSDSLEGLVRNSISQNLLVDYGLRSAEEHFIEKIEDEVLRKNVHSLFSETTNPLEYLDRVFKLSQSENAFELFLFNQSNQCDWLANLMFVKQFIQCGGNIFNTENYELRDFALCGIVTVLDKSTDVIVASPHAFEETPLLEALTSLYIELFFVLSTAAKAGGHPEQCIEEWNEFYAPTIRTYFIRMFRAIRRDQQPTPFVRSLLKVLFDFSEFPENVPSDDVAAREFVPELSVFNYSPFQESCISHSFNLLTSNVEHVQLIGFAVAKLLTPIMFRTENEKALESQENAEITVPNRPKLALPVMISKSFPTDHNHTHLASLLLHLSLMPLELSDASFNQEQRVAYCDAIDSFFKNALNSLLLDQPFDFRTPFSCRIPKSLEREYYLETDLNATPVYFDKFVSRLLFKSMTLLPAAVRLFYKGMPNCFMPMFQEAVTKYASKLLIENELSKVRQATLGGEMKVRTVPVTGEIIAEYVVEETKMKLTIGLPPDYPLSVPTMTLDKAIVKSDRAKKWLLQLNAYLFHQNGAILEGIEMWKRNVDKGVEGVEDCTICMMTVHQQTHQLPKVKCKQCKNKFHSNCLYKWFESSNQSTCPLCRNNFT